MAQQTDYVKELTHIRSMMERSSRFISLSGLSGVFAGLFALAGAGAIYYQLHYGEFRQYQGFAIRNTASYDDALLRFCSVVAGLVLICSIGICIYLSTRKARQNGHKIFDRTALRLVLNLGIPLAAGGLFCLALLYHGLPGLLAPAMLIFYGLGLINGSKYTFDDIRYLGLCEIVLGLIAAFFTAYGLVFWAFGFGVLHIVYGLAMYNKYDRN